jgi:8-oxo-dGTP diphosphatase
VSDIYKAAGILIRDRKLLVERSEGKEFYISPGGSIEEGETEKQALKRELKEEFDIETSEDDFEEFGEFSAPAAGQEHRVVHMKVFKVLRWVGEPTPSSEVRDLAWVTSKNPDRLRIGSIIEHDVFPMLVERDLID